MFLYDIDSKAIFLKNENLFDKVYCFLVERTAMGNATYFRVKLPCQKPKLKWVEVQNGLSQRTGFCHERLYLFMYLIIYLFIYLFIFLKIWFEYQNLLWIVNWMYHLPKYLYSYFSYALKFCLRLRFPASILKLEGS